MSQIKPAPQFDYGLCIITAKALKIQKNGHLKEGKYFLKSQLAHMNCKNITAKHDKRVKKKELNGKSRVYL